MIDRIVDFIDRKLDPDGMFQAGPLPENMQTPPESQTAQEQSQLLNDTLLIGGIAGVGEVLRRVGSSMYRENTSRTNKALSVPVGIVGYGLLGAALLMTTSKIALACEDWINDYRSMKQMDEFANSNGY